MTPTEADIMDITILSAKINTLLSVRNKRSLLFLTIFNAVSTTAKAQFDLTGSVNADVIEQNIRSEESGVLSLTTLTVTPSVYASYRSKTIRGLWAGTLTHVDRENDTAGQTQNYAEYTYSAQWTPFERLLDFQASGALTYRNTDSTNYLLSDFITNSDSLAKTRSNTLRANVLVEQNNWVNLQGTASYSDVSSESSVTIGDTALDNDSYQINGSVTNGEYARYLIWELDGAYQNTANNNSSDSDFVTRSANGFADIRMSNSWAIRVTARHEANQIEGRLDSATAKREYNSYGAGITYRQNENRYISVTLNQSDSDESENSSESFVGLDLKWALSSRTQINGNYGRRFYGESASASIEYNSKHFRSSLSYGEEVTNTSRLLANPENLGVFVCPVGSTTISNCFQPDSLSYTPSIDEQFVQLSSLNIEFDDSVILQKRTNLQVGYDFSRVIWAFTWLFSENDYLDQNRLQRTLSLGSSLSYQIGSYTSLNSEINFAKIDGQSDDNSLDGSSDNWNALIGLSRTIGNNLETSLSITYLDKSGDLSNGNSLFGSDYTDRRITLSVTYTYQ
jgi:uncharacterized protein (PEP-CTERM system associated)